MMDQHEMNDLAGVSEKPRLVFANGQGEELRKLVDRYQVRVGPGIIVGRRYGSTAIIEHLEANSVARESEETERLPIMPGDHLHGWHKGYRQALRIVGLQQLGWWMHLEAAPDSELFDELDRVRILEQPEWGIVPAHVKERPDPYFLTTWLPDSASVIQTRAVQIIRETQELREVEIELNF